MTRVVLLALAAAGLAAPALAAPDWSKAPKKTITVFYPGVASMEWTLVGTEGLESLLPGDWRRHGQEDRQRAEAGA